MVIGRKNLCKYNVENTEDFLFIPDKITHKDVIDLFICTRYTRTKNTQPYMVRKKLSVC